MSITAVVRNYVQFTGDQEIDLPYSSGELEDSPAMQELINLAQGDNTVTVPDIDDFVTHGLVIVPPSGNSIEIRLKGILGDTGFLLSASQVSCLQFGETPPSTIVLSVLSDLDGVRLIWF